MPSNPLSSQTFGWTALCLAWNFLVARLHQCFPWKTSQPHATTALGRALLMRKQLSVCVFLLVDFASMKHKVISRVNLPADFPLISFSSARYYIGKDKTKQHLNLFRSRVPTERCLHDCSNPWCGRHNLSGRLCCDSTPMLSRRPCNHSRLCAPAEAAPACSTSSFNAHGSTMSFNCTQN